MNAFTRKLAANPIENGRCAAKPFGCGQPVNPTIDFRDALSRREYNISGMCQMCQDSVFDDDTKEIFTDDAEVWERNQLAADWGSI